VSDYEPLIVLDQPSRMVQVSLHRDQLVGLHALIHWLKGYEMSGNGSGRVPGAFELVMHYRSLRSSLEPAKPTTRGYVSQEPPNQ
jgi:hypothetical protein